MLVFILLATTALPTVAHSADADTAGLRFSRVYVPAGQPEDWPRRDDRYVPMERDEFERMVAAARRPMAAAGARISTAAYTARLVDDHLLKGRLLEGLAGLDVEHSGDQAALLSLDPCGLAIGKASWAGRQPQDAALGTGGDGRPTLRVERGGRLRFDWSLRGRREASDAVDFELNFPPCPSTALILDLPETEIPLPDRGIVTRQARTADGLRRWRIELGGHYRVKLRIATGPYEEGPSEEGPSAIVRQSLVYDFSQRGVEVSARLELDAHREPLRRVSLTLDGELRLVAAMDGQRPLTWSVAPDREGGRTRVVLELPEPIEGTGRIVRLRALAPLVLDRPWRLPSIRPEGMFWQQGAATLLVPGSLLVEQLRVTGGRQTKTGPLPAPPSQNSPSGESIALQYFAPDAAVRVVLGRPRAPVQVHCGTAVELSGGEVTGRTVAELRVADTEKFLLEADVARHWIIDSVESTPGDIVGDWSLERKTDGRRTLAIRLAKALSPSRGPVRLVIAARRLQSPLGRILTVDDLVPLRFPAPHGGRRLVAVRAVEPYELRPYELHTAGTEAITRIDPGSLESSELTLFAEPPRGLLFEDNAAAERLRMTLRKQTPRYAGTIRVEATVDAGALTESYRFACTPESARVDRVLVCFSHGRVEPPRWTLGGEDDGGGDGDGEPLTAKQLTPAEQAAAGLGPEGEAWEITLRRPRSVPFEIRATRTTPLSKRQPLSLAALPEATTQQATLVVRHDGSTDVEIENKRLHPIPAEPVPPELYQTARATYRYDPTRLAGFASEAAITVSPGMEESSRPAAWVWSSRLESRFAVDGGGSHLATYRLQSSGRKQLRLTLPSMVTLDNVQGVWVGDDPVAWQKARPGDDHRLVIDLPAGVAFPIVAVQFTTTGPRLGIARRLSPPLPEADVPVLARQWTLWLPPGYEPAGDDLRRQPRRRPSPTWTQRLFGPVGQAAGQGPLDPFSAEDWLRAAMIDPDRSAAEQYARHLVQQLGATAEKQTTGKNASPLDWGTLFERQSSDSAGCALLFDREALAGLGIDPRTMLAARPAGEPASDGLALLQQAGLALLVHRDAVLVTGATQAALYSAQLAPLEGETLWRVLPGPLADRLYEAAVGQSDPASDPAMVTAETWNEDSATPKPPWAGRPSVGFTASDTLGWTACWLEIGAEPAAVSIVHRRSVRALRWSAFLLVLALAWWKAADRPLLLTVLAGLLGVVALLLPTVVAAVASGGLLGLVVCLGFLFVRRKQVSVDPHAGVPPEAPPSSRTVTMGLASIAMFAAALGFPSGSVLGEDIETGKLERNNFSTLKQLPSPGVATPGLSSDCVAPGLRYSVFFPVDEKQKPSGDKCFVPEGLYKELNRRAVPGSWLLLGAVYHGDFSWKAEPKQLVPGLLRAVFELEVFAEHARVCIPLGGKGAAPAPAGAILDGRAIRPQWRHDEDGGGLLVLDIRGTGRHRLEVALQPTVYNNTVHNNEAQNDDLPRAGGTGFDLSVPRLANARLELTLPRGAPNIEVPSAVGSVSVEPRRLIARLGATDRLSVRWGEDASCGGTCSVDAEELLWLRIQPGSVVLDAKLKYKVVEGRFRRLLLNVDPRLRLLEISPAVALHKLPGRECIRQLELSRPCSDQVVVEASFLLEESSGVGDIRLPRLKTLDVRTIRRWMAVSVNPELQYKQRKQRVAVKRQDTRGAKTLSVPDFVAAWGATETKPSLAYGFVAEEPSWSIATSPRDSRTTVDQTLILSFGRQAADVRLDAQLVTAAGYRFQYRLQVPASLRVETISLLEEDEEDVERVARWSRAVDGAITVFLSGPVAGRQKLALRGSLPTPRQGTLPLPAIRIENTELASEVIHVFRQGPVLVKIGETGGLVESEAPPLDGNTRELGRPVKSFSGVGEQPLAATVVLSPNRPKVRARQVTTVSTDGTSWYAAVDCRVEVGGGVVDEIRLDVPEELIDRCKIDPPATLVPWETPSGGTGVSPVLLQKHGQDARATHRIDPAGTKGLLVRGPSAVTETFRFTIRCPLDLKPGDRLSAAEIVVRGVDEVSRIVVLPRQWQGRPIAWEGHGLKKIKMPEGWATPPVLPESPAAYQIVSGRFEVVLASPNHLSGAAEVHLADVNVAWRADGTCWGAACFDLAPAGRSSCPLFVPEGLQLVQLSVGGVPTTALPRDVAAGRLYRVSLGPKMLPQRIEVVFAGRPTGYLSGGRRRFDAPRLGDLPVRRTLWSIVGPPLYEPAGAAGADLVSPLQHELIRMNSLAALVEPASRITGEGSEEMARWYRAWAPRLAGSLERVRQYTSRAAGTDLAQTARAELPTIERMQNEIAGRLGVNDAAAPVSAGTAGQASSGTRCTLDRCCSTARCATQGGPGSVTLSYRRIEPGWICGRLPGALALGMLICLTVLGVRRGLLPGLLDRLPHLSVVIVGLVWWLLLWPSVLGVVIVLLSLTLWLRSRWRPRREDGSVIVPLG